MANWVLRRRVDLKGIGVQTPGMLNAVKGDARAHTWEVELNISNAPADLTGYSAYAKVVRYGGTIEIPATIAGNVITAILPQACYAYEGTHPCLMRIVKASDGVSVAVDALHLTVSAGETDVVIDPSTVVPNVDQLLSLIDDMEQATADANAGASAANAAAAAVNGRVTALETTVGAHASQLADITSCLTVENETWEVA